MGTTSLWITADRGARPWMTSRRALAELDGTTVAGIQAMTSPSFELWGSPGRVGKISQGEWAGRLIFAYPDTIPE